MKNPTDEKIKPSLTDEFIRAQFPILNIQVNNKPLVYLDNAATSQKPILVIEAGSNYYKTVNSNVHRGVHRLSQEASKVYEDARKNTANFINAASHKEIVFTKGTTEGINLVAQSFVKPMLNKGDEIIVSEMEHHSNILPWQMIAKEKDAVLKVINVLNSGEINLAEVEKVFSPKTKFLALTHVSNTLGTINDVEEIIKLAHSKNIKVLIDGAQAVPHMKVDVQKIDADFYVFGAHKIYGPTGFGILYGKDNLLNEMSPYQGGGGIIVSVDFNETVYAESPLKFEAGTPHIEGSASWNAAIQFCTDTGMDFIFEKEKKLTEYATEKLLQINGIRIFGNSTHKAGVISFNYKNIHPFDVGTLLDKYGIAVRTGHHCTQPLMKKFEIPGTVRMSFAVYNTISEVDYFIDSLKKVITMLE